MVINEMAGSGGDALPWMFRQEKLGPLVGTPNLGWTRWHQRLSVASRWRRCHGATRGNLRITRRMGSRKSRHRAGHRSRKRSRFRRRSHDAQLEKAVQVTLDALKKNPVVIRIIRPIRIIIKRCSEILLQSGAVNTPDSMC